MAAPPPPGRWKLMADATRNRARKPRFSASPAPMPEQPPQWGGNSGKSRWAEPRTSHPGGDPLHPVQEPAMLAGVPVGVQIPEFIDLVQGKFVEAARKIKENNARPGVCAASAAGGAVREAW